MIREISHFWLRHIHPRLITLIATIGIGGLAICLLILFIVAKIAGEVLEKEAFAFDKSFLLLLHNQANPAFDNLMLFITQLGDPTIVIIVAGITLAILWWRHYRLEAIIFILTSG